MPRARKKLPISCDAVDCGNGLHCFNATKEMKTRNRPDGSCWQCGTNLVDWTRVHNRDVSDAKYTMESLKHECVRHHFWHKDINQRAVNHALRKGERDLITCVRTHLQHSIGSAKPFRDGSQTTMRDDVPTAMPYGQHATATCCRSCLEFWHGIPKNRELTEDELNYCSDMVFLYIKDRIPGLTQDGQYVAPIRKRRNRAH